MRFAGVEGSAFLEGPTSEFRLRILHRAPADPVPYSGWTSFLSSSRCALRESSRFAVAFGGGVGGATPAVSEPSPSFCSVRASSLPVGLNPCADCYFLKASAVEASHFPVGTPSYEPFVAKAA